MTQAQLEIATGRILAVGDFPGGPPDETVEIVDLDPVQVAKLSQPGDKVMDQDGTITVLPLPPPSAEEIAEEARQARLQAAMPPEAVLTKLHDGTALTTPELQTVVRYLGLHRLRIAEREIEHHEVREARG